MNRLYSAHCNLLSVDDVSIRYLNINDRLANRDGVLFEGMTVTNCT